MPTSRGQRSTWRGGVPVGSAHNVCCKRDPLQMEETSRKRLRESEQAGSGSEEGDGEEGKAPKRLKPDENPEGKLVIVLSYYFLR